MPKTVKCQNRKGKKCIQFNGKNVYYVDINDLAKKLNILPRDARNLINDNGRRIVIGPGDETLLINIKLDNYRGLLKRHFGIKRINNNKVIKDVFDIPAKDVSGAKVIGPNSKGKYQIKILLYVNFPSPQPLSINDISTKGKVDRVKVNNYIDAGSIVVRGPEIYVYRGYTKDIPDYVKERAEEKAADFRFGTILFYDFSISDSYRDKKLHFEEGYIRQPDALRLTEWANIEYNDDDGSGDSCIVRFMKNRYPKYYWNFKNIETKKGIRLDNFMKICEELSIGYKIFDEQGKLIYNEIRDNGCVTCIIFNNHIYGINGGRPRKYPSKHHNIKYVSESFKLLKKMLNSDKILPRKINIGYIQRRNKLNDIGKINITSFLDKDTKYICNDEYQECLDILTKMGYAEYIYDDIRITAIPKLLEKILRVPDTWSFIPEMEQFKTSALLWKSHNNIDAENLSTDDKNKAYSSALKSLPYILRHDYRKHKIVLNPKEINDTYLYLASPKYWTILTPKTKLYAGYHLTRCKEIGIQFELLEELETDRIPNYYRQIIDMMYENMRPESFKYAMNVFIGNMERNLSKDYVTEYVGIYNDESADMREGFCKKIGNYNLMFKETEQYNHVRNRLPIATQIKDMSRMVLYDRIKELDLSDNDIKQINTDSITYSNGKKLNDYDATKLDGWKKSEFKELGELEECIDKELVLKNIPNTNDKKRILHMKYAGSGKTTYIIEKLVPRLIKSGISYIVLTPTHPTLSEYKNAGERYKLYKKHGIRCEIMQKYVFNNQIPEEDFIIVDEIGFIDRGCHDLLYKIIKANKGLECFGDFNQLQPAGEDRAFNQPHYLNYMFNEIDEEFINYRNNFTKKYYDSLINATDVSYLSDEVNKWACKKFEDAEYIICYRHKTRELYNDLMLAELGFDQWNSVGVKIVCRTNKLLDQDIYNHKQFQIVKIIKNKLIFTYTLEDSSGKTYEITEKKLFANFEPAYAINVHQAQGMTLKSYYWATDDDNFLNGNVAYTVISRLKQEKIKD